MRLTAIVSDHIYIIYLLCFGGVILTYFLYVIMYLTALVRSILKVNVVVLCVRFCLSIIRGLLYSHCGTMFRK